MLPSKVLPLKLHRRGRLVRAVRRGVKELAKDARRLGPPLRHHERATGLVELAQLAARGAEGGAKGLGTRAGIGRRKYLVGRGWQVGAAVCAEGRAVCGVANAEAGRPNGCIGLDTRGRTWLLGGLPWAWLP